MYTYKAKIVKWIDGDTVVLDIDLGFDMWLRGAYTRLNHIDTPETYLAQGYTEELKQFGLQVKQYCEDTWPAGTEVQIITEYNNSKDKYGRILATVVVERERDVTVQSILLDAKYAIPYTDNFVTRTKSHLSNMTPK